MKERYEELRALLSKLFRELSFPMGGENEHMLSIYMTERDSLRLIAIVTRNGYTLVTADGQVLHYTSIDEVERAFLVYFGSREGAEKELLKALGLDE